MNGFREILADNFPGISSFQFVDVTDVETVSEPDGMEVTVTLKSGKDWLDGYSSERFTYTENVEDDDNGDLYSVSLSGFFPGDDEELLAYFIALKKKRYLLKVKDNNNYVRLMGSVDIPARFTVVRIVDTQELGYRFRFTAVHADLPPFFTE